MTCHLRTMPFLEGNSVLIDTRSPTLVYNTYRVPGAEGECQIGGRLVSLHRRFVRFAMPATKTQEQRQSLIDGCDLFARKVAEYATNPAFVDGSEMVDQREGLSGKAAPAWRQGRIKESLARSPGHRDHAHEREALVAYDIRIAYYDAGPCTALFAADCRIEIHHDERAAADLHARSATQPLPETQRTGFSAPPVTSASASSSGKPLVHSSNPCSASPALSGCGFFSDRRSSARNRRSSSRRTASATNLLRLFSSRSMSLTRSLGRLTVTRSTLGISYSGYDHTTTPITSAPALAK